MGETRHSPLDEPAARSDRSSLSYRTVFAGMVVSMVAALAVAGYIYARYVRYDSVASSHVPPSSSRVVRVGVQQAVAYEPFRSHLLPLLEIARSGGPSRLVALQESTGLELGVDARELIWATDDRGRWLLALGGMFPSEGILEGIRELFRSDGIPLKVESNPPRLEHASGIGFAASRRGALLLASDVQLLKEAVAGFEGPPGVLDHVPALDGLPALSVGDSLSECCDPVTAAGVTVLAGSDFPARALVSGPESDPPGWGAVGARRMLVHTSGWQWTRQGAHWLGQGSLSRDDFDRALRLLAAEIRAQLSR